MKVLLLKEEQKINEGLRSLTEEFIDEYPYYAEWVKKNEHTFKSGERVVYELEDCNKTVGYMMVHFSTSKYAKVNGIYVFPEFQRNGYAKQALLEILNELKNNDSEYVYIQTRLHNKIVVHMFESLKFDVIGKNYHNIEMKDNWVAVFDLKRKRNFTEMTSLAESIYPGFESLGY